MHEREMRPRAETPQHDIADPAKRRWQAPHVTVLDAKETLSGSPSASEETPLLKPGS